MVRPCFCAKLCPLGLMLMQAIQTIQAAELDETDFLQTGVPVLTASRLAQPAMDTPNAVTVLDRATIEATGYHDLSDLFRLVPGVYVGRMRGWFHNVTHTMADEYARRMQVLVDGRSVYLPVVGGVRWDALPLAIDDIERIEVVRGPNAATYGANALTGVINIITRHPEDVEGRLLHVLAGNQGQQEGWFRWAANLPAGSHRLTLGHRKDGGFRRMHDSEHSNLLNYRAILDLPDYRSLDVQLGYLEGDRGDGRSDEILRMPHEADVRSYFAQLDYRQPLTAGSELLGKLYYNHFTSNADIPVGAIPGSHYKEDVAVSRWHGEFQINTSLTPGLRASLGAYLRQEGARSEHYFNRRDTLHAYSKGGFGHVEWRLSPDWLLNAGAFYERYTGIGDRLSPRLTLSWQPSPNHTLRAGISKAYRNPLLFESKADWRMALKDEDGNLLGLFGPYIRASNPISPESLLSREISYLGQWLEQGVSLDVRLFSERLNDFISAECPPGGNCKGLLPPDSRDFFNIGSATQRGLETQVKWQPARHTQFLANYAYLHIDSNFDEEHYSPRHLIGLHWMHRLPGGLDLTLSRYWASSFEPIGQRWLPASNRWDVHLAKGIRLGEARARISLGLENVGGEYREFSRSDSNRFDTRGYVHLKMDF